MPPRIEMTGMKIGRLTVLGPGHSERGQWIWRCSCECGATVCVRGNDMRQGRHKSCGCLQKERTSRANTQHGQSGTSLHWLWSAMIDRCVNPNNKRYARYGGRGITVCERWRHDFSAFAADIGPRPDKSLSIDRINNDGHYEPGNVRWATRSEQSKNRGKWKAGNDTPRLGSKATASVRRKSRTIGGGAPSA